MDESTVRDVNENPCHMCMPMGGILALKGIEKTMVILHGSQGCSTYMRRHIAEHFNEPIDVASSSLNEKGTIYGGEKNLKQALDNVRRVYNPSLIGVLTTCLAETIGEDIDRITQDYLLENPGLPLKIVTAPTPGYGGTHSEGYFFTLRRIIASLAEKVPSHRRLNLLVPNISTADVREIKNILGRMNIEATLCPDLSETLDRPYSSHYTKMPIGGTPQDAIRAMGGALATIQFGVTVADDLSPGKYLEDTFGVPLYNLPLPIGLANTDAFIDALHRITGQPVPDSFNDERGRLLDAMVDSHKYNFQGRCAIFGDAELVSAVTDTCRENGIHPVLVATGGKNPLLTARLTPLLADGVCASEILETADFVTIREKCQAAGVNLAIGHSDGRYLTEKSGIPLVRMGFPILDRVGGQRILSVGYTGTAMLLDRLTNTLLENKHKTYRNTMYERFYPDSDRKRSLKLAR